MRSLTPILFCLTAFVSVSALAQEGSRPVDDTRVEPRVRSILSTHCFDCHSKTSEKLKGDLFLDQLSADFADEKNRGHWSDLLKRVRAGEMPPKGKPQLSKDEVEVLTVWVEARIKAAEAARLAQGRVVLRRLNRVEYENTVRDLLGVEADLKELLALDSAQDGFDNVGAALHVSSFAMQRYLEAGDAALGLAISNRPKPPPLIKKRYKLTETHQVKVASERVFRKLEDDAVVNFTSSHWQAVTLSPFYPSERGNYRFRISVSGFQSQGKPVTFRVMSGVGGMAGEMHLLGYFDAPADKPTVIEFTDRMEARASINILPYGLARSNVVDKVGADKYEGPGLAVQWVEVEGPLNETWPPASHRRLFGDLSQDRAPKPEARDRVEVVSKDPLADADRILRQFARRAFRRAVSDDDLRPYLALVQAKLAEKRTFEQAVRAGLLAILVSPDFLFLRERPGKLDDFALASRLSYFLWNSMPDDELFTLAGQHKLTQPEVLHAQVERLFKSPKARAFTENFVGQWLGLRDIDFTEPSHQLYPEYDPMLRASMVRETELFFDEVLKGDMSLTTFISSDFAMINGRLAKHYGIPGVDGWEFRRVTLPKDSHRGGVLTMASVLKTTANGTTTSPVVRGAWVLDRILGTPPPRPPADVPAIEPDTRGAKTIRDQLAKHRANSACAGCHVKIDPPGFALESFDVIGGWRDNHRSTGLGTQVVIDGQRMPYFKGPKVEAGDVMPDGERFRNIDEFKQILLKNKDQFARTLTVKLLTYSTGAAPTASDTKEVEAIVARVRDKQYGFRTLVHEIVQSPLFRNK